jgi:hypothetical protein
MSMDACFSANMCRRVYEYEQPMNAGPGFHSRNLTGRKTFYTKVTAVNAKGIVP